MTKRHKAPGRADAHEPAVASDPDDDFARAMADVVPLPPDQRERVGPGRRIDVPPAPRPAERSSREDEADDGREASFVAPGVDRRELRKLKRGEHAVDHRLDLHGMTAADAVAAVRRFIDSSRHCRHRAVAIVHGRGLHSDGNIAILRTRVREYLRHNRAVLAYTDAPQSDGGTGVVYVLLRK